jgi:hypothetical protein
VTAKQSRLTAVPDGPPGELERRSALGSLEAVEDLTGSGANDVFSLRVGRSTLVLRVLRARGTGTSTGPSSG